MKLVCFECWNKFDHPRLRRNDNCPRNECSGQLYEIDDMLVYPIQKLWEAGLITEFCCAGHLEEEILHPYVVFGCYSYTKEELDLFLKQCESLFNSVEVMKNGVNPIIKVSDQRGGTIKERVEMQARFVLALLELASQCAKN